MEQAALDGRLLWGQRSKQRRRWEPQGVSPRFAMYNYHCDRVQRPKEGKPKRLRSHPRASGAEAPQDRHLYGFPSRCRCA